VDIHHPELFERLRIGLLPFRIKSIETDSYRPIGRENKYFPDDPHAPTYSVKVITGLKVPKGFVASLAMEAHIHVSHLRIDGDGDVELVNKPEEVSDVQRLVGSKRIADFIGELKADRKQREQNTTRREVYESYCTTHRGVEDLVKKPIRKGYYMVESYNLGGRDFLTAHGPLTDRPTLEYRDRISVAAVGPAQESSSAELYTVTLAVERKPQCG
jgi:hypothetical protein